MTDRDDKDVKVESAEVVKTAGGRQYHLQVAPGEVAPYVLLCGDPDRAERTAARFDRVEVENRYREYVTITGTYRGIPVSVCGTGIGPDNNEIAFIELSQCVESPTFLRIGTCGALPPHIGIGELIISTGAVRLENTSTYFVPEGYPAVAHPEVVIAMAQAASSTGVRYHVGLTATAPGFYGAQGRRVPGFAPRYPELPAELEAMRVLNFEMEASLILTLASLRGFRAGVVCAVFANRHADRFIDLDEKTEVEGRVISAGLGAVEILDAMAKERGDEPVWHRGVKEES